MHDAADEDERMPKLVGQLEEIHGPLIAGGQMGYAGVRRPLDDC
jgi:hypothetical protein